MSTQTGRAEVESQLQALQRLAGLLRDASDVPSLAKALAGFLCELFDCAAASLVLVDEKNDELVFHTASAVTGRMLNRARLRRGEGIAGWVCEHHCALNVDDARIDPRFCDRVDVQTGFFTRTVLAAPLYRQGQIEGAIEVLNRIDGQPFDSDDERLLSVIAEQVELLVANAVLISGLEKRNRELSALIEVDRAMIRQNDIQELIGVILRSVTQVVSAAGSCIVLVDHRHDCLRFFQAVGPAKDRLLDIRLERGEGIVGQCIDHGEPIWVPDPYSDSRFARTVDESTGFVTESILAVPLRTNEGVIGALELVNLAETSDHDEQRALVEAFASQAAQAIERAQYLQGLVLRADEAASELAITGRTLAVEQAKLAAMIEQMGDALVMVDTQDRLLVLNPAARRLFGIDEDLTGRSALEVRNVGLAAVLAIGDTGPRGEELVVEQTEKQILLVHSATVHDIDGQAFGRVVVCGDITELKELAKVRSDLVSFVSHELRTPLTGIKLWVGNLAGDDRLAEPELRQSLHIIDQQCDRLRRIVDDMLCLSLIESGRHLEVHWRRFDLNELVTRVVDGQRMFDLRHEFVCELAEQRVVVEGDPEKIEQVLTNLISNAVKYSDKGTRVTVTTGCEGDDAVVSVRDEGYGIAAEDIPQLFRPFSRLPEARQRGIRGTGIGLSLSKQLIDAHSGGMSVESEPGVGSKFTFRWPRRRPWEE